MRTSLLFLTLALLAIPATLLAPATLLHAQEEGETERAGSRESSTQVTPLPEDERPDKSSWALSYLLVILLIALGLIVVCRPVHRSAELKLDRD